MRYEYSTSTSIYLKATSASSEEIMGYVKWDPPSSSVPTPPSHSLNDVITGPQYMLGADRTLFRSMSDEHNKALERITAGREHWYLSGIVVDPDHQGKGVGSALLEWGTKRADQDVLGVFCLSSAEVSLSFAEETVDKGRELMVRAGNCTHDEDLSRDYGVLLTLKRGNSYASVLYGGNQFTRQLYDMEVQVDHAKLPQMKSSAYKSNT
jgi:GNAT superfamily N-acetyltransferase